MAATCKGDASAVTVSASPVTISNAPPKHTTNKTAAFSFIGPNASDCGCLNPGLLICKLDDSVYADCNIGKVTYFDLDSGPHTFRVCINGTDTPNWNSTKLKQIDCAQPYNWIIDRAAPTSLLSILSRTGMIVSVNITFTEPCPTFQCSSAASCNVLVKGPGEIVPSSLEVVKPGVEYKFSVRLDPTNTIMYGQVNLSMNEGFCIDPAGNKFKPTGKSSLSIPFDRRNQWSNLSCPQFPVKRFKLNGTLMSSSLATNNVDTLKFVINFSQPVVNSSQQILRALKFNNASQGGRIDVPVDGGKLESNNQTFSFMVTSLSQIRRAVINVRLEPHSIITTHGNVVSPFLPFSFLYDTERPEVWLSTSKFRTKEDNISISIHFEKPVVDFSSSNITISGGNVTSFRRIDLFTYQVKVHAVSDRISVNVPENATEDLAGNSNLASIFPLKVWHVPNPPPTLSILSSRFATASFVGLSVTSGLLTISTAAHQVSGASPSSSLTSLPSTNLLRMLSFLQVISLSRWLMDTPNEYFELAQRLQWSVLRYNLPWEHKPKPSDSGIISKQTLTSSLIGFRTIHQRIPSSGKPTPDAVPSTKTAVTIQETEKTCQNPDENNVISVALYSDEKDKKEISIWKKIWEDNKFLAFTTGATLAVHLLLVLLLKSKRKKSSEKPINYGGLTFPRLELFLALEAISGLSQAFSSLIHERKPLEVAVGITGVVFVLLAVLALFVFLFVGITLRKLLYYEEEEPYRKEGPKLCELILGSGGKEEEEPYRKEGRKLCGLILGSGGKAQWTWKGQPDSVYLTMYGLLFEDLRGPLHPNLMHPETVLFKDAIWRLRRSLSCYYNFIDSLKRVCLAILASAEIENCFRKLPAITLLCINSLVLLFLILVKPFTERRAQLVNIITVGSEIGIYVLGMSLQVSHEKETKLVGKLMVILFIVGALALIANEVYGQYKEVKKLDNPDGNGSFSKGFKIALQGLYSFCTCSPSPHQSKAEEDPVSKNSPKTASPLVGSSKGAITNTEAASTPTQTQNTEDGKSKSKDAQEPQNDASC